jgi:hypothetical protein
VATKVLVSDGRIELVVTGCWNGRDAAKVSSELGAAGRLDRVVVVLDVSGCDVSPAQLTRLVRGSVDPAGLDLRVVGAATAAIPVGAAR